MAKTAKKVIEVSKTENVYQYKGVVYNLRTKNWKQYRIPAILFKRKYEEFEKKFLPENLERDIKKLFMNKNVIEKVKYVTGIEDLQTKISQNILTDLIENQPDKFIDLDTFNKVKIAIQEEFLLDTNNAKELCNIMLENSETINHEDMDRIEYKEYMTFMKTVLTDFFLI